MTREEFLFAKHIRFIPTRLFILANITVPALPKNLRRVTLAIAGQANNVFSSVSFGPVAGINFGLNLGSPHDVKEFYFRDWGDLLHQEVWFTPDVNGQYVFWEGVLDCPCELKEIWGA